MVGMSTYNLLLHFHCTPLSGLLPGFIVAFILDVFIVGVLAKKIAFLYPLIKKTAITYSDHFESHDYQHGDRRLFGLLMEGQTLSLSAYFQAWGLNFIVALPYQLLIVGPFHV